MATMKQCMTVQEAGRKGGKAKVAKGFASKRVRDKALATRRRNARMRKAAHHAL